MEVKKKQKIIVAVSFIAVLFCALIVLNAKEKLPWPEESDQRFAEFAIFDSGEIHSLPSFFLSNGSRVQSAIFLRGNLYIYEKDYLKFRIVKIDPVLNATELLFASSGSIKSTTLAHSGNESPPTFVEYDDKLFFVYNVTRHEAGLVAID